MSNSGTDGAARAAAKMRGSGLEVCEGADVLFSRSLDHTRCSAPPLAVVFANRQEDIGACLSIANEFKAGVSVRGRGTGCAGGAVPIDGSIVLDLSRLDKISIDPAARIATVEAGAITADIDARANEFGLFYGPDPSSHKYCSIGGNIACNAGGLRALKYGVTRDNVASLVAYTGEGRRIVCARPLRKFSAGLNLRDLFIGSEGLLGVVAQASLRLLPLPEARRTLAAFFDDDFAAFDGVEKIMKSPLEPSALEFMDADTVACVRVKFPELGIPSGKAALLIEFDGSEKEAAQSAAKCAKLFASAREAASEEETKKLWLIRRGASSAMYLLADSKLNQDIVLPPEALKPYFAYYKGVAKKFGLSAPVFGHSGDGNYHIHFLYSGSDSGQKKRAEEAMDLSIKKAIELGGAVSGEHGIGFLKSKYMPLQHSEYEIALMRSIKKVFDPNNILNRGKVLFESGLAGKIEPLKGIKLPWD